MFNYRDWWSWVFWFFFIIATIDLISALPTLERWKWGYWSIDLIPGLIIILFLYLVNQFVWSSRTSQRIRELEQKIKELKEK